ncbi:MAG: tetratricopeptide repeat-containing sensor histidine kinase [Candidatus Cyclobacteriaceae bacterium M2_1C_046]
MIRGIFLILIFFSLNGFSQEAESQLFTLLKDSAIFSDKKNKAVWFRRIGEQYLLNNKADSAKKYLFKSLYYKDVPQHNDKHLAATLNNLGVLFHSSEYLDSALNYYNKAKRIYLKSQNIKASAYADINIGIIYKELGNYEMALEHLFSAENILSKFDRNREYSSCLNTIATIYYRQNNLVEALNYYKQSLTVREELNLEKQVAYSYNNLGIIYRNLSIYDSSLLYYNKSLKLKEKLNDIKGIGASYNNIGRVLIDQKKYDLAESHLLKSAFFREKSKDKIGETATLNNLGLLYFSLNQPKKALAYLNESALLLDTLGLLEELKNNLQIKLQVYEYLGQYNNALVASKKLLVVKDSLLNKEKVHALIEMQTKYESDKKIQEIAILQQKQQLQQAQIDLRQTWIWVLLLSVCLVSVILFLIYSKWKKEQINKRKIQILMQELHHRVKNNLQLLSSLFGLQSKSIIDKVALEAVKSGENRVNAMAIIHQKLYTTSETASVNLKEYLTALVDELADSFGYDIENDNIFVKIADVDMDVDKVISLGLIVNEVVSNAFKYAFPKVEAPYLLVEVVQKQNIIILKIADNGYGFESNGKTEKSMGLKIIETLSRQLRAKTKWITKGSVTFDLQMAVND